MLYSKSLLTCLLSPVEDLGGTVAGWACMLAMYYGYNSN